MSGRSLNELRDELKRLTMEHIESLKKETFGQLSPEELRQYEARLKQIREVSADYLAALKRSFRSHADEEKP
jgi:uncharacterized protein with von Willebrand factor type A (vWA) domain